MIATLDAVIVPTRAASQRCVLPPLPAPVDRTMDATHLNAVANHPDVRPWLGGEGPLDLSPLVANPAHVATVTPHGGFLCLAQGEGRYEVHSLFLPEGRGKEAYDAMRATQDYMFAATDCVEGLTKVPRPNRAAAAMTLRAGFERRFTGPLRWSASDIVEADFYGLSIERWSLRSAITAQLGQWFHTELARVKAEWHSTLPDHSEDDTTHDRTVGAAILMIRAGNAPKAERFYNAWARFAGYPTIHLLREQPIVIDLGGIIIEARQDEMEILQCQQE